jgi:hypothetical protein
MRLQAVVDAPAAPPRCAEDALRGGARPCRGAGESLWIAEERRGHGVAVSAIIAGESDARLRRGAAPARDWVTPPPSQRDREG